MTWKKVQFPLSSDDVRQILERLLRLIAAASLSSNDICPPGLAGLLHSTAGGAR